MKIPPEYEGTLYTGKCGALQNVIEMTRKLTERDKITFVACANVGRRISETFVQRRENTDPLDNPASSFIQLKKKLTQQTSLNCECECVGASLGM